MSDHLKTFRKQRPLAHLSVGISISESDDLADRGFTPEEVNRATVRLAEALYSQGARVAFGHDWRPDGVMVAVLNAALNLSLSATADDKGEPPLVNLVPWPDEPTLPTGGADDWRAILRVEKAGLPSDLAGQYDRIASAQATKPDSDAFRYFRSRALTHLRRCLVDRTNARVCLGGKTSRFSGRYPGILEEAYFAARQKQPLYVSGLMGGAAMGLIDALGGETSCPKWFSDTARPRKTKKGDATTLAALYDLERDQGPAPEHPEDKAIKPVDVWKFFNKWGVKGLSAANGLTDEQNRRLFEAGTIDQVVRLVLTGLGRIAGRR